MPEIDTIVPRNFTFLMPKHNRRFTRNEYYLKIEALIESISIRAHDLVTRSSDGCETILKPYLMQPIAFSYYPPKSNEYSVGLYSYAYIFMIFEFMI